MAANMRSLRLAAAGRFNVCYTYYILWLSCRRHFAAILTDILRPHAVVGMIALCSVTLTASLPSLSPLPKSALPFRLVFDLNICVFRLVQPDIGLIIRELHLFTYSPRPDLCAAPLCTAPV